MKDKAIRFFCCTTVECIVCKLDANGIQLMQKLFVVASIQSTEMNLIIKEIQCLTVDDDQTKDTRVDQIIVLLNDDSIYIWKPLNGETLKDDDKEKNTYDYEIKKRIRPIELKDRYLDKNKTDKVSKQDLLDNVNRGKSSENMFLDKIIKDYSKGLISFFQISIESQRMIVGTIDGFLLVFTMDKWELLTVCQSLNVGFLKAELFDMVINDGISGSCGLSIILSDQRVALYELNSSTEFQVMGILKKNGIRRQSVSKNGNMLANVSSNGKIYIYNVMTVWSVFKRTFKDTMDAERQHAKELNLINKQVR